MTSTFNTMPDNYVELYHDPERDTYEVAVRGEDEDQWDIMCDLEEQEAIDEADGIAAELDVEVIRT